MLEPRSSLARCFAVALLTLCPLSLLSLGAMGCGEEKGKLKPEECSAIRSKAYKIVNAPGHPCNTDGDCKETTWPECRKAANTKAMEELTGLEKQFTEGKCKDDTVCKEKAPRIYCKQGLCAVDEPGTKVD